MTSSPKVFALALLALSAFAQQPKIAPDLETQDQNSMVDVIVQYNHVPSESQHQRVLALGGTLRRQLDVINSSHYAMSVRALRNLAEDSDVIHISPNHKLQASQLQASQPSQTPVDVAENSVNANIAYSYGWNGNGIGVAVIDSGISSDPDLKNAQGNMRVVYQQDFVGGGTNDQYGHGEHVAGIVAGNGSNSSAPNDFLTFRGVAPNANLINLRVLDQNGGGTDSTVIAAIQQAIFLKYWFNIRVINLSLGRPVFESYTVDP